MKYPVKCKNDSMCTVPSPDVDQSQSQCLVGPLKGPKEESQQIDCLRHRLVGEASPG